MIEAAFDGALDGALDTGGGDGEDSMASEWWLRLCLEREVCLDVSVCDDRALDLLEWCEWTLPSLVRRGTWSGTKDEMSVLGATLWATLRAFDTETTLSGFAEEAMLRAFSMVSSSGLVTDRARVYFERAWDGATEWAGAYSMALGVAVWALETCDAE
jgi:hypothetical protein